MSIRRIDPEVHSWLREQAAQHGVSVEEEVRSLLRAARDAAVAAQRREEQARWDAVFALAVTPAARYARLHRDHPRDAGRALTAARPRRWSMRPSRSSGCSRSPGATGPAPFPRRASSCSLRTCSAPNAATSCGAWCGRSASMHRCWSASGGDRRRSLGVVPFRLESQRGRAPTVGAAGPSDLRLPVPRPRARPRRRARHGRWALPPRIAASGRPAGRASSRAPLSAARRGRADQASQIGLPSGPFTRRHTSWMLGWTAFGRAT